MLGPFLLLESADENLDEQRNQHDQSSYSEPSNKAERVFDKRHERTFSVALGFAAQREVVRALRGLR